MKSVKATVAVLSMLGFCAPALAADQAAEKAGQADMKAAMQGEMERQLLVSMVALKDFCKQSEPDKSAEFDASWEKNTADVPAELKTFSATPEFQGKVAARVKQLGDSSKTTAGGAEIKTACEKIIATK